MPLKVLLEDEVGELRAGSEPEAVIRYRTNTGGHSEDAAQDSVDKAGKIDPIRFGAALWGALILGWEGLFDGKGKPVPFKCPAQVLGRVRDQVKDLKLKLTEPEIERRAQGEWVNAVIRGLPTTVKAQLQAAVNAGKAQANEALGN